MTSLKCIKNTQFNYAKACLDNGCESECYFSKSDKNPFGICVLPGSNKFIEYPQKNCNLNDGCDANPNFLDCIRTCDLCPKAFPPTTICIRDSSDFAAISQVNFFNGDLVISDKLIGNNNNFHGLPTPHNDLIDILPNLLGINGSLYIIGTEYRRISGFEKLRFVTGSIYIVNNPNLISLPSFPNLLNVGGQVIFNPGQSSCPCDDSTTTCEKSVIVIANNICLRKISGFEAIRQVQDGIFIVDNTCLTHICGFIHLYRTDRIVVHSNPKLTKIIGFCYIDAINIGLFILNNNSDGEYDFVIGAFTNLENAGKIVIIDNNNLKSIKLESIRVVEEFVVRSNNQLEELLSSLQFVDSLFIECNKKLLNIQFPCLQEVNKVLNINANCSLLCINSFNELKKVGDGIMIADNKQLTEINGFNKLKYIGSKCVCRPTVQLPTDCNSCECINDINFDWSTLVVLDDCTVINNFTPEIFDPSSYLCEFQLSDDLFSLVCNSIKQCCDLVIDDCVPTCLSYSIIIFRNQRLKAIGGFCNLKHVNSNIYIVNNAILHTINAFGQLAFALDIWIRNNVALKYIIGFGNLIAVRDFVVSESSKLTDLDSLNSLEFAQKIAIEAKNTKTVKYSKNPIPSVLGYVLYYCYDN